MSRLSEADRLAEANKLFRFAMAHNITLPEARQRLSAIRQEERRQRFERCGTEIQPEPRERPQFWWEKY